MSLLESHLAELIRADVLDVAGGGVELQPAFAVDIGDPQRPFDVEHVRVRIGHRHQNLCQTASPGPAWYSLVQILP